VFTSTLRSVGLSETAALESGNFFYRRKFFEVQIFSLSFVLGKYYYFSIFWSPESSKVIQKKLTAEEKQFKIAELINLKK